MSGCPAEQVGTHRSLSRSLAGYPTDSIHAIRAKTQRDFEFGSHCPRIASDVKRIRATVFGNAGPLSTLLPSLLNQQLKSFKTLLQLKQLRIRAYTQLSKSRLLLPTDGFHASGKLPRYL